MVYELNEFGIRARPRSYGNEEDKFMKSGMQFSTLKIDNPQTGIWILTIQRPEVLNALNSQVLNEMSDFLRQIGEMSFEHARVLIITGAGDKAFVAGADIKEISQLNEKEAEIFAQRGQGVFRELSLLKIPVIAAVNGFALGGGCELALGCDFIYAAESAQFGLPEVGLGLIPGFGGTVQLSRAIGIRQAREWTLTGSKVSAPEAFRLGLVNKVVPPGELLSSVMKTAETLLTRAPIAVGAAKKSINETYCMDWDAGLTQEASNFSDLFASEDVYEGTQAFIEKRKPQFQGK